MTALDHMLERLKKTLAPTGASTHDPSLKFAVIKVLTRARPLAVPGEGLDIIGKQTLAGQSRISVYRS